MKIIFYGLWPELANRLKIKLKKIPLAIHAEGINPDNLDPKTEILAVFVESPVTKEIIRRLPRLKLIATMSTGYDHLDLAECKKRGIIVCNVPSYGDNTVAEHTFALILGLTRKLFLSVKRVKEGQYDFHGLRGVDLKGKTIGVIGTGRIGSNVIRLAKSFAMQVIACDAFPNKTLAAKLGFAYVSLAKLLKTADIITLHAPLLKSTRHLINQKNINTIKPGSYLVNTARGALVDPEALLGALQSNRLAGAGLDVLEDEDLLHHESELIGHHCTNCQIKTSLMNNLLIDHPNTIITPHNAFNSAEALQRIVDVTAENIKSFLDGKVTNQVK